MADVVKCDTRNIPLAFFPSVDSLSNDGPVCVSSSLEFYP